MEYSDTILLYVTGVCGYWWFIVTGVVMAIEAFAQKYFPRYKEVLDKRISKKHKFIVKAVILLVAFICANYLTFHQAKIEQCPKEQKNLSQTNQNNYSSGNKQFVFNNEVENLKIETETFSLTQEQILTAIQIIKEHTSEGAKPKIGILCVEDNKYCKQWREIFSDSGWNIFTPSGIGIASDFHGIGLSMPEKSNDAIGIATAVYSIFGIKTEARIDESLKNINAYILSVGTPESS